MGFLVDEKAENRLQRLDLNRRKVEVAPHEVKYALSRWMKSVVAGLLCLGVVMGSGWIRVSEAREWSRPIRLTRPIGGTMDEDFDITIDNRNRIHVVYTLKGLHAEQDTGWGGGDRTMYQQFDLQGNALTQPVEVVEDVPYQQHCRIVVDQENNAHVICSTNQAPPEWVNTFYYSRFDAEGQRVVGPNPIDGTIYRGTAWDEGNSDPMFFRRSDCIFILASRVIHEEPGDSVVRGGIAYILFDSTGRSLIDPQVPWLDDPNADPPIGYFNLHSSLDSGDNLHFTWRRLQFGVPNQTLYACISAENEIIREPITITPAINQHIGSEPHGLFAKDPNSIYLLRLDGRYQGEPYQVYLQRITGVGRPVWQQPVLVTENGSSSIEQSNIFWHGRLYFAGRMTPNPDSSWVYYHYFASVDTAGNVEDSLQLMQIVPPNASASPKLLRTDDRLLAFYTQDDGHNRDRYIAMIQKSDTSMSVAQPDPSTLVPPLSPKIDIFPQPSNPSPQLRIQNKIPGTLKIGLYSIEGRMVGKSELKLSRDSNSVYPLNSLFSTASLPAGQYYLTWAFDKGGVNYVPITIIK